MKILWLIVDSMSYYNIYPDFSNSNVSKDAYMAYIN